MKLKLSLLLAVASLSVSSAAVIPAASTLAGLNPGDTYRFVFVSSTTTSNSNSLATYNNYVQGLANSASIGASAGVTWTAVLSVGSGSNNAASNAPVSATTRVYLLDGTMVANGTTVPFYTGTTVDHLAAINYTETGVTLTGSTNFVWSGGNASGSESGSGLVGGGRPVLGNASGLSGCPCRGTNPGETPGGGWARYDNTDNLGLSSTGSFRVYAMSSLFTAPTSSAVPEPSTFGMAAIALAAVAFLRRKS